MLRTSVQILFVRVISGIWFVTASLSAIVFIKFHAMGKDGCSLMHHGLECNKIDWQNSGCGLSCKFLRLLIGFCILIRCLRLLDCIHSHGKAVHIVGVHPRHGYAAIAGHVDAMLARKCSHLQHHAGEHSLCLSHTGARAS